MPSLYAKYIREREGKLIIENDKGFITYSLLPNGAYVYDMFIEMEHRMSGEGTKLMNEVVEQAKTANCPHLYGGICPAANGATDAVKFAISYGMRLDSAQPNYIVFKKDI
jgi:hypothetical protein